MTMATETPKGAATTNVARRMVPMAPRVVRLGKYKKKHIKKMKRGHGKLAEDLQQMAANEAAKRGTSESGKPYQPLVIVYEEKESKKKRRKRRKKSRGGFLGMSRKQLRRAGLGG
jgi:hypothetical protein